MLKHTVVLGILCHLTIVESSVQGIKPTNILGSSEQHTSFSFIRPGLTQTSFAFNGPSSHQTFSSSIGNPQLAQRVLPSIAHALAHRNPALGYYPVNPLANGYGIIPTFALPASGPLTYQIASDPVTTLAYMQQLQQQQQQAYIHGNPAYQTQLAQLLALRQMQQQAPSQQLHQQYGQLQGIQIHEQVPLQQQQESSNLSENTYSSAPSVAHVKVVGNGYKYDF